MAKKKVKKKEQKYDAVQFFQLSDHEDVIVDETSPTGFSIPIAGDGLIRHIVTVGHWIIDLPQNAHQIMADEEFQATYQDDVN